MQNVFTNLKLQGALLGIYALFRSFKYKGQLNNQKHLWVILYCICHNILNFSFKIKCFLFFISINGLIISRFSTRVEISTWYIELKFHLG